MREAERLSAGFEKFVDELADQRLGGAPAWHELTPQALRAATKNIRKGAAPIAGVSKRDIVIETGAATLDARLYEPVVLAGPSGGLIYFHGGGFTIGSIDTHDAIVARIASVSGIRILSVEYRLAPEHPFPAAHDDALASCRWAFDHADAIGFDRDRIAIGGDSAGANLAASACLDLRSDADRRLRYLMLFYPNTTIDRPSGSRETYAEGYYLTLPAAEHLFRHYVDADQAANPRIDLAGRNDLAGLPPTYLAIGHCDILADECWALGRALMMSGVSVTVQTYPGFIHGFLGFADREPAVHRAYDDVGRALRAALAA